MLSPLLVDLHQRGGKQVGKVIWFLSPLQTKAGDKLATPSVVGPVGQKVLGYGLGNGRK